MNFNLNRYLALVKHDFTLYRKPLFLGLGGIFLLILIVSTLNCLESPPNTTPLNTAYWSSWLFMLIMPGCLTLTSVIYWEFKESSSRLQYLILPASNFEKTLSRWSYTLILAPLACVILVSSARFILKTTGHVGEHFLFGSDIFPYLFCIYAISHSTLFMFAIWFNKYVAAKATIISFVVFVLIIFISALIFYTVFNDCFNGWSMSNDIRIVPKKNFQSFVEVKLKSVLLSVGTILSTVFFFIVSYFKMKEKQV